MVHFPCNWYIYIYIYICIYIYKKIKFTTNKLHQFLNTKALLHVSANFYFHLQCLKTYNNNNNNNTNNNNNAILTQCTRFNSILASYILPLTVASLYNNAANVFSTDTPWRLRRYSDSLRAGRSGYRISVEAKFSSSVQTGPGTHPASSAMGFGSHSRG